MSFSVRHFFSRADYDSETFFKRLVGKTNVEDALLRLDSLTKEESLMAVARNLEATHRVHVVVRGVDADVKETKILTEVIAHNVKETKGGTQPSSCMY